MLRTLILVRQKLRCWHPIRPPQSVLLRSSIAASTSAGESAPAVTGTPRPGKLCKKTSRRRVDTVKIWPVQHRCSICQRSEPVMPAGPGLLGGLLTGHALPGQVGCALAFGLVRRAGSPHCLCPTRRSLLSNASTRCTHDSKFTRLVDSIAPSSCAGIHNGYSHNFAPVLPD